MEYLLYWALSGMVAAALLFFFSDEPISVWQVIVGVLVTPFCGALLFIGVIIAVIDKVEHNSDHWLNKKISKRKI